MDRDVYKEPTPEQKKCGKIWKLKKAVYGMNDAGRKWYFKVEETLNRFWRLGTLKRERQRKWSETSRDCEQRQGGDQRETEGKENGISVILPLVT